MYQHQPSGLYLTWARLYNPTVGRWTQRDPIEESSGLNLYAYCANNPINEIDPSGTVGIIVVGLMAGTVIVLGTSVVILLHRRTP